MCFRIHTRGFLDTTLSAEIVLQGTIKEMGKPKKAKKRSTLFEKILARLLLVGVMPLAVLASVIFALVYLSYHSTNTAFENAILDVKTDEVTRSIRNDVNDFRFTIDPATAGADGVLNPSQQAALITRLFAAHADELEEISFLHAVPAVQTVPAGQETARCVRDSEAPDGYSCTILNLVEHPSVELRLREKSALFRRLTAGQAAMYVGSDEWTEDGIPTVVFGVPIVLELPDQEIISTIVAGRLRIGGLQDAFATTTLRGRGTVFLLDRTGLVLAHSSRKEFIRRDASSLFEVLRSEIRSDDSGGGFVAVTAIRPRLFAEGLSFTSVAPFIVEGALFFIVAEWPIVDAFIEVIFIGIFTLAVWLALLVVVWFVGRHFSRSIVTPIRAVERRAAQIGRGNFEERLKLETGDELEDLGESLNRMAEDLKRLEHVRNAETRARALAQAIAKEHQLEEEKDSLLATASHQFRTPVTALNWNIELLKEKKLPKDVNVLLDGISEHAKNLAAIAGDLLNATAFGAGYRAEPGEEPVDLAAVVDTAIEKYARRFREKNVTVMREKTTVPVLVRGNDTALRIAIEQLMDNAWIYSNDETSVSVSLSSDEKGQAPLRPDSAEAPTGEQGFEGQATLVLKDQGIGIPKDEQRYLFNPFFRAKNAIVKKNVGTGLGLFIANNIITGHAGTIKIESEEDEGTTVTVTLPGVQAAKQTGETEGLRGPGGPTS